jgi:hypothetical protein
LPPNEPPDPPASDSRRTALFGLIFVAVLVVGALLLWHVLRDVSAVQDCAMSGRTNCAPISATPADSR